MLLILNANKSIIGAVTAIVKNEIHFENDLRKIDLTAKFDKEKVKEILDDKKETYFVSELFISDKDLKLSLDELKEAHKAELAKLNK